MTTIDQLVRSHIAACEAAGARVPARLQMMIGGHVMFVDTAGFKARKPVIPHREKNEQGTRPRK